MDADERGKNGAEGAHRPAIAGSPQLNALPKSYPRMDADERGRWSRLGVRLKNGAWGAGAVCKEPPGSGHCDARGRGIGSVFKRGSKIDCRAKYVID
jgi:hypothetical protein